MALNYCSQVRVEFISKVDLFVRLVGYDRLLTRLPVGRTDFAVLVSKLERLDKSESFINRASNGIIVDLHGAKLTSAVNDKNATEGRAKHGVLRVIHKNAVVTRHIFANIGEEWVVDFAKTALRAGRVDPREMGEVGVSGNAKNVCVDFLELAKRL